MALLKVFWTRTAIMQRNSIFEYWNNRNQTTEYSKKLRLMINKNIQLLKRHPKAGKKTDYKSVRALMLGNFSLLYQFDDEHITIVAFWDNRQNPEKLLAILQEDYFKKN